VLRYPVSFAHGPFSFNEHINADGTIDRTKVQNTVLLDSREQPLAEFRDGREALHLATGGALGRAHKGLLYVPLRGRILVPNATQQAKLADRERAMRAAFDPSKCYIDSPTTDGAYALDFTEPTTDTANFANGRMPLRYYCRPVGHPRIGETLADGATRPFALNLVAADPRTFAQTERTQALALGGATTVIAAKGTVRAPLKVTIVMSGAGSTAFILREQSLFDFVLNLSGTVNLDSIVVIFETCGPYGRGKLITKNGVENFALKTSSPATWMHMAPGNTTWSVPDGGAAGTTNVTSVTLAWYDAWA
jgi:hypothetical protein